MRNEPEGAAHVPDCITVCWFLLQTAGRGAPGALGATGLGPDTHSASLPRKRREQRASACGCLPIKLHAQAGGWLAAPAHGPPADPRPQRVDRLSADSLTHRPVSSACGRSICGKGTFLKITFSQRVGMNS